MNWQTVRCSNRTHAAFPSCVVLFYFVTPTYRHLPRPGAVALADSVLGPSRQEVAVLTAVHQGVAEARQVHPHHVHMQRALRLFAGVGCRGSKEEKGLIVTAGRKRRSLTWRRWGAALRTNALGLRSAPGQVGLAGPGGGALDQVSRLALKGHNAAHLHREEDRQQHLWKVKARQKKKKKHPTSGQNVRANCSERSPRKRASATFALKAAKGVVASQEVTRWRQEAAEKWGEDYRNYCQLQLFM